LIERVVESFDLMTRLVALVDRKRQLYEAGADVRDVIGRHGV
jgi:hypothetical protein